MAVPPGDTSHSPECRPSAGPPGGSSHSTVPWPCSSIPGCPARTAVISGSVRRNRQAQHRREDALAGAFGAQDPLELAHPVGAAQAGEGQRAPGDAQRDTERGLVGTVAGDVADHDVHGPVRRLDEVVEVAAEQRVLPARPVPRDDLDARVVEQQRRGQQPALEPGVLLRAKLAGVQLDGGELGALALDRVEHRAPQHLGFDPALDQVVLRAGGDRRDAEVLVGQPGQHHDRHAGVALADALRARRCRWRRAGSGPAARSPGGRARVGVRRRPSTAPTRSRCRRRRRRSALRPATRRRDRPRPAAPTAAGRPLCGRRRISRGIKRRAHRSSRPFYVTSPWSR